MNFLKLKKCEHEKLDSNLDGGYCPDCGEYVENRWYLIRCACCGIKRVAMSYNGEIFPTELYCSNCGTQNFYIEELKKVNFIDINYAAMLKVLIHLPKVDYTQSWIKNEKIKQKYLIMNKKS